MSARQDSQICRLMLARGSKSFAAAGRLLPARVLDQAAAIYAFCREADDAIDDAGSARAAARAHGDLQRRLAALTAAPSAAALGTSVDRALKRVLQGRSLPTAPLQFLLDGFLWDAQARRYPSLRHTLDYSARVAGSVGVVLAQLCGCTSSGVLARAADMGVAMQLVNIARDVGEDARRGRLYVPERWLSEAGLPAAQFLAAPAPHPALAQATERLLAWADALFARARLGLFALPWYARWSFASAGRIYQDIGRSLRRSQYANVQARATVGGARKVALVTRALVADGWRPRSTVARRRLARPPLWANRSLVAEASR